MERQARNAVIWAGNWLVEEDAVILRGLQERSRLEAETCPTLKLYELIVGHLSAS